jgi:putative phosphoribosyl transferase
MRLPFEDRVDAGRRLAAYLSAYAGHPDAVVLGLPRGGIPVAYQVAVGLHLPLDVFLVRKLGVPGQEELAFGAVGMGGLRVLNEDLVAATGLTSHMIQSLTEREEREIAAREELYRKGFPPFSVRGKVVILVDDGLATGASMLAAVRTIRRMDPARIVVAVPVGPAQAVDVFTGEADEVVCPYTPAPFRSVGLWYENFDQVRDEEVRKLLARASARYVNQAQSI